MAIDKNSLPWIGYTIMATAVGLSEGQMEENWVLNATTWTAVAEAIERAAIARYRVASNQENEPAPKPSYGNFLEITRIMSGG